MEDEYQLPTDAMIFLALNTNAVEGFVEEIIRDLDEGLHEDWLHTKLLDHMYRAEEEDGITMAAFQNLAAGALLLLAIERKKRT